MRAGGLVSESDWPSGGLAFSANKIPRPPSLAPCCHLSRRISKSAAAVAASDYEDDDNDVDDDDGDRFGNK